YALNLDAWRESRSLHERAALLLWLGGVWGSPPCDPGDRGRWRVPVGLLDAGGPDDAGQSLAPPPVRASFPPAPPSPGHARMGSASGLCRPDPRRGPFFVLLRWCRSGVRGMGRDLCGCPPAGQCDRGRLSDRRVLARVYRGPPVRHSPGDALGPTPDGPGGLVAVSRSP